MIFYRGGGVVIGLFLACAFYAPRVFVSSKTLGVLDCTLGGELELIEAVPYSPAEAREDKS